MSNGEDLAQLNSSSQQEQQLVVSEALAAGLLNEVQPHCERLNKQLKELINRQNKLLIELSEVRHGLDTVDVVKVAELMEGNVKTTREQLISVKTLLKTQESRVNNLKKRSKILENVTQKELERKKQEIAAKKI